MNRKYGPRGMIAALVAMGLAGTATAAEPGFYISATLGQSSIDVGQNEQDMLDSEILGALDDLGFTITNARSDLDKSVMGYELAVGYQFTPYFAVEGGWIDLGAAQYEAEFTANDGGGPLEGEAEVEMGASGPALSLVGIWPLGESFSVDVRAGAFFARSKVKVELELDGDSGSESESDTKTQVLLGAGVNWSVAERTTLRLGYTHFDKGVGDEFDVGRFSLGVKYAF